MMIPVLKRSLGLVAVAAFLAACGVDTVVTAPDGPLFSHGDFPQVVTLCKSNEEAPGTQATFSIASTGGGTLPSGNVVTLTAVTFPPNPDTDCAEVWKSDGSEGNFFVTVTEVDMTAGTEIERIVALSDRGNQELFGVNTVTVDVDFHNSAIVFFKNRGTPTNGGEGCTPGYWRNHLEDWGPTGLDPGDDFDSTFGVDFFDPDITLDDAINLGGGGVRKVARHGTAALLNALHPDVGYPYSAAEVIAMVQAGDVEMLAEANELGCEID